MRTARAASAVVLATCLFALHRSISVSSPPRLDATFVERAAADVRGAAAHTYGLRDSRGVPMDCARVVSAPIEGSQRYLALYHHRESGGGQFDVFLAQSFDLMHWEQLRRLITRADMPDLVVGPSGQVLVVYEHFASALEQWPSSVGVRLYASTAELVAGHPTAEFIAPNELAQLEGTPSVVEWDAAAGSIDIALHFQNRTRLRDEMARARLVGFPGPSPKWTVASDPAYTARFNVSGNVGGRARLRLSDGRTAILQEGNRIPGYPTNFSGWRVFIATEGGAGLDAPRQVQLETHGGSRSVGNPTMTLLPAPGGTAHVLLFGYYIFRERAAKREAGQLVFYHPAAPT